MEKEEANDFWEEGSSSETMSSEEAEEKMKTFHMKHDEEMNFKIVANAVRKYPPITRIGTLGCAMIASTEYIFIK